MKCCLKSLFDPFLSEKVSHKAGQADSTKSRKDWYCVFLDEDYYSNKDVTRTWGKKGGVESLPGYIEGLHKYPIKINILERY